MATKKKNKQDETDTTNGTSVSHDNGNPSDNAVLNNPANGYNSETSDNGDEGKTEKLEFSEAPTVQPSQESGSNTSSEGQGESQPGAAETEQKEEKRGRHKKDCKCEKCLSKKQPEAGQEHPKEQPTEKHAKSSLLDSVNSQNAGSKPAAPANQQDAPQSPKKVNLGNYISGTMLIILMDNTVPFLLTKVAGMIEPKYKQIKARSIRMDEEQRKELAPLADEVCKVAFGEVDPLLGFFIISALIYGGNLIEKGAELPDAPKAIKQPEKARK